MLDPKIQAALDSNPEVMSKNTKWAAKLQFDERCSAFAAVKAGMLKKMVALAFGINPSTLEHMLNNASKHYKSVRIEYRDLGHERFLVKYLTEDTVNRVLAFKHDPRLAVNQKVLEKEVSSGRTKAIGADKRANHKEGTFTVFSKLDGTLHVQVAWVAEPGNHIETGDDRKEGWYARIERSSPDWNERFGDYWYGENGTHLTSKSALDYFLSSTLSELV